MAGSVNKVILIGNLGRDPDIRTLGSGDRVANLRLATSEIWRDKATGERKEKTEWHSIAIFNDRIVKVIEQYVKKGSTVYVEGALQTRKYTDKDGQERYSTEVVIQRFNGQLTMLGGKPATSREDDANRRGGGGSDAYGAQSGAGSYGGSAGGRVHNAGPKESFPRDLDDDIPFASWDRVW